MINFSQWKEVWVRVNGNDVHKGGWQYSVFKQPYTLWLFFSLHWRNWFTASESSHCGKMDWGKSILNLTLWGLQIDLVTLLPSVLLSGVSVNNIRHTVSFFFSNTMKEVNGAAPPSTRYMLEEHTSSELIKRGLGYIFAILRNAQLHIFISTMLMMQYWARTKTWETGRCLLPHFYLAGGLGTKKRNQFPALLFFL